MKCCHGADEVAVRGLSVPVVEVAVAQVQVPSGRRRALSRGPMPGLNKRAGARND